MTRGNNTWHMVLRNRSNKTKLKSSSWRRKYVVKNWVKSDNLIPNHKLMTFPNCLMTTNIISIIKQVRVDSGNTETMNSFVPQCSNCSVTEMANQHINKWQDFWSNSIYMYMRLSVSNDGIKKLLTF
jgi:hypothetical protein